MTCPTPEQLQLSQWVARHAADRAFWLARAAVYAARGDTDTSDCISEAGKARERMDAAEEQMKRITT